jgi:hypothetical protein
VALRENQGRGDRASVVADPPGGGELTSHHGVPIRFFAGIATANHTLEDDNLGWIDVIVPSHALDPVEILDRRRNGVRDARRRGRRVSASLQAELGVAPARPRSSTEDRARARRAASRPYRSRPRFDRRHEARSADRSSSRSAWSVAAREAGRRRSVPGSLRAAPRADRRLRSRERSLAVHVPVGSRGSGRSFDCGSEVVARGRGCAG